MSEEVLTKQARQAIQQTAAVVPVHEIDDSYVWNCRGKINVIDVNHLVVDIAAKGLMQRVLVRPLINGNFKYRVIAGFSRMIALKVLRWKEIPIDIRECTDEEAAFLNLSENLVRTDLNFIQEANAVKNLGCKYPQLDDEEIGKRLGQNRGWVQVRLFALSFPDEIQDTISKGIMTYDQIRFCYKLKTREAQFDFVRKVKEAHERGLRVDVRKKKVDMTEIPSKVRDRTTIFAMQEHIVASLKTNNFGTRCLAWAAGEIPDVELFGDIANIADNEGIPYKIPHKLVMSVLEQAVNT